MRSSAAPRRPRMGGLGIPGLTREELAASWQRDQGETVPPPAPPPPRPAERAAAEAWGPRHAQLALAALHRLLAAELDAGRWPPPLGLRSASEITRAELLDVLARLRDGVLPDGAPTERSPVLAAVDVEKVVRDIERRVERETAPPAPRRG